MVNIKFFLSRLELGYNQARIYDGWISKALVLKSLTGASMPSIIGTVYLTFIV